MNTELKDSQLKDIIGGTDGAAFEEYEAHRCGGWYVMAWHVRNTGIECEYTDYALYDSYGNLVHVYKAGMETKESAFRDCEKYGRGTTPNGRV